MPNGNLLAKLLLLIFNKRPRGLYADDFFQVLRDIIGFCGKSEAR